MWGPSRPGALHDVTRGTPKAAQHNMPGTTGEGRLARGCRGLTRPLSQANARAGSVMMDTWSGARGDPRRETWLAVLNYGRRERAARARATA
jgi:hypothetical protein